MEEDKKARIESICKKLGITTYTYYARRQRGWTEDEATLIPKMTAVHMINGESVHKYLKRVGGSYNAFKYRLNCGFSLEEAVKQAENIRPYKRRKKNEM